MNTKPLQHGIPPLWPRTLVTGATSGIGYQLALQLAAQGVRVLALGRDAQRLQALKDRCPAMDTLVCDLADVASLPAQAAQWVAAYPDLGCVIHNAAVQDDVRMDAAGYGASQLQREVGINLVAPLVLTQALLPHLLRQPRACVVNITSGLAFAPKKTAAVYSASKAGLQRFSDGLRVQLQDSPVRVVEVVMPLVDTAMTAGRGRNKLSPARAAQAMIAGLPSATGTLWVGKARWIPWLLRLAPGVLRRILQGG